jgi:hypothetical protein
MKARAGSRKVPLIVSETGDPVLAKPAMSASMGSGLEMTKENFLLFQPYPFEIGQKIRISSGPRSGDWEVIGQDERKVRLRCPVSHREFEWDRFCYLVEKATDEEWPQRH